MKFRVLGTLKAREVSHLLRNGMIYPGVYDAGVDSFPAELKEIFLAEVEADRGLVEVIAETVQPSFLDVKLPEPEEKEVEEPVEPEEKEVEESTEESEAKPIIKKVVRKKKA